MKLVFYKLPNEAGENVIITDSYAYRDSELALYLEDKDLDLDFYDLISYNDGSDNTISKVEDDPENVDPYIIIDSDMNLEATLPFRNEESASRFIDAVLKWQDYLNKAYDE